MLNIDALIQRCSVKSSKKVDFSQMKAQIEKESVDISKKELNESPFKRRSSLRECDSEINQNTENIGETRSSKDQEIELRVFETKFNEGNNTSENELEDEADPSKSFESLNCSESKEKTAFGTDNTNMNIIQEEHSEFATDNTTETVEAAAGKTSVQHKMDRYNSKISEDHSIESTPETKTNSPQLKKVEVTEDELTIKKTPNQEQEPWEEKSESNSNSQVHSLNYMSEERGTYSLVNTGKYTDNEVLLGTSRELKCTATTVITFENTNSFNQNTTTIDEVKTTKFQIESQPSNHSPKDPVTHTNINTNGYAYVNEMNEGTGNENFKAVEQNKMGSNAKGI